MLLLEDLISKELTGLFNSIPQMVNIQKIIFKSNSCKMLKNIFTESDVPVEVRTLREELFYSCFQPRWPTSNI